MKKKQKEASWSWGVCFCRLWKCTFLSFGKELIYRALAINACGYLLRPQNPYFHLPHLSCHLTNLYKNKKKHPYVTNTLAQDLDPFFGVSFGFCGLRFVGICQVSRDISCMTRGICT